MIIDKRESSLYSLISLCIVVVVIHHSIVLLITIIHKAVRVIHHVRQVFVAPDGDCICILFIKLFFTLFNYNFQLW